MPPFVDSFGDQLTAVIINSFGAILIEFAGAIISLIFTNFIMPLIQGVGSSLGAPA